MELILLPGMDGTGILFQPFLNSVSNGISTKVIHYPCDQELSYNELTNYVQKQLPKDKEYVLLAESFSGPIAYKLANNENLKAIIFVASFIQLPNKLLAVSKVLPLSFFIPRQLPNVILKFLLGPLASKEIYNLVNESLAKVKKHVFSFRLREMAKLPKNNVATINKSIYIQAISDNLVSEEHADKIKQVSKESKQYKVEGSHFILQVNPDKCSEIVQNEINLLTSSCSEKSGRDLKSETTTSFPES
ncbi:MAG: hypothetical protein GY694_07510 [Gammaproteobacteria bacterium]|nr:hypothetical protein [Gammaproteobacteria bacterium]